MLKLNEIEWDGWLEELVMPPIKEYRWVLENEALQITIKSGYKSLDLATCEFEAFKNENEIANFKWKAN